MKITKVRWEAVHVNRRGDWLFVIVETDGSVEGIGEIQAGVNYADRVEALSRLARELQGYDPRKIEPLVRRMVEMNHDAATLGAFSAIEQALWDIAGKLTDAPTWRQFSSSSGDPVHLYANINRATEDRSPDGFARNAAAAVADGFDAVKLAPFDGFPYQIDRASEAEEGIACVEAVRESIGPRIRLMVDVHCHFTVKGALELADALRPLDLFWIEQPFLETDLDAVAQYRKECGIRLAGGEGFTRASEFVDLLKHQCLDVIMPDICHVGGVQVLREIAKAASDYGTSFSPHGPRGPIALVASSQAVSSLPQFVMMEFAWGEVPWRPQLTTPTEVIRDGRLTFSDAPGLGLELNLKMLEEHRVSAVEGQAED